ncbi:class I SAM-dependent methyltransferase [Apibacter muscae]|uniref:Class I SAM-dependent methyltransferase n=1 Tax=Apibacter muscae TaxID=2509004 RepID=A0A563DKU3_9FLAO|nr:class I SAM-dependent methyltransferase [Apibacter muscae]TWP30571.1 class I SAM-dependent methyltransferase [Apibacter muscae]TWP31407.1 class I SAM-dependent methyltransferase [Apibacter muscae]
MEIKYIENYWDKQATIWREEKEDAWDLPETKYWLQYFKQLLPTLSGKKVLEVGTASGYFANLLSLAGYQVTAVDLSSKMIEEAKEVTQKLKLSIDYQVMDAQNLDFESNTFDLVFTRLMTWTLPDVNKFYQLSYNILKPQGKLINFDGDMGKIQFSSEEGHERYPSEIMEEANKIKANLEISKNDRPTYDLELLKKIGFINVVSDNKIQNEILHKDISVKSLFQISAQKP